MIPDSKLTWFKLNASTFLTSTVGLSNRDVGAYIKLLAYSWVNGPIPNNPKVLSSIAGKSDMELITSRFFELNQHGKLCDPRLEASRAEAAEILEKNRKRTEKARSNRWEDSPSRISNSLSLMSNGSVTATEDKDKDKDKEITGPVKTGQTVAHTPTPKPSVASGQGCLAPKNASGQKIQPGVTAPALPDSNSATPAHGPNWEDS
jgi:uncharacterized protein YdaU (DUF1376 family)